MTTVKTFKSANTSTKITDYEDVNKQINDYAKNNDLSIKNIYYDRLSDCVIANVIFSIIPNELWLL